MSVTAARHDTGRRRTHVNDATSADAAVSTSDGGAPHASGERYARGTRSYTMSHIRGKDTGIEVLVRRYLFSRGLRFRKNDRRYLGHPDVVLPKWHTIVFVNGCFWHMHQGCSKHSMPKSHVEFWSAKLLRNRERDRRQHIELRASGWQVIDVWECELDKTHRQKRLERLFGQITGGGVVGVPDVSRRCG